MQVFVDEIRALDAPIRQHIVIDHRPGNLSAHLAGAPVAIPGPADAARLLKGRALGPNELFFINSTSGTTGMPKCVTHTQNRWK
jgi:acyl-CoA synthetase